MEWAIVPFRGNPLVGETEQRRLRTFLCEHVEELARFLFPLKSSFFPDILQGSIIQKEDAFFFDNIPCLLGGQKIKICLADVIPVWFDGK
jgi:hypothetical protein